MCTVLYLTTKHTGIDLCTCVRNPLDMRTCNHPDDPSLTPSHSQIFFNVSMSVTFFQRHNFDSNGM